MAKIGIMHSGTHGHQHHKDNTDRFKDGAKSLVIGQLDFDDGPHNWAGNHRGTLDAIASRLIGDASIDLVAALGGTASLTAAMNANNPQRKKIVFSTADVAPTPR